MTLYWKQSPGFLRTTMKRSCDNLANANHATEGRHANSFFEVGNLVQDQGVRALGFQNDLVFNWRLACAVTAEPARSLLVSITPCTRKSAIELLICGTVAKSSG